VKQPGRRAGSARHRTLADFVTRILALIPKNGAFVTVRLVLSALRHTYGYRARMGFEMSDRRPEAIASFVLAAATVAPTTH